jgi:hypothetical protein
MQKSEKVTLYDVQKISKQMGVAKIQTWHLHNSHQKHYCLSRYACFVYRCTYRLEKKYLIDKWGFQFTKTWCLANITITLTETEVMAFNNHLGCAICFDPDNDTTDKIQ